MIVDMDRREFLKTSAIAAVAAAIPLGTIFSSLKPDIVFSSHYSLEWDRWVLTGKIIDGDCIYTCSVQHTSNDAREMIENFIRDALTDRIRVIKIGSTTKLPLRTHLLFR